MEYAVQEYDSGMSNGASTSTAAEMPRTIGTATAVTRGLGVGGAGSRRDFQGRSIYADAIETLLAKVREAPAESDLMHLITIAEGRPETPGLCFLIYAAWAALSIVLWAQIE